MTFFRLVLMACSIVLVFNACSKEPKPVGNFISTECKTQCANSKCREVCTTIQGDFK